MLPLPERGARHPSWSMAASRTPTSSRTPRTDRIRGGHRPPIRLGPNGRSRGVPDAFSRPNAMFRRDHRPRLDHESYAAPGNDRDCHHVTWPVGLCRAQRSAPSYFAGSSPRLVACHCSPVRRRSSAGTNRRRQSGNRTVRPQRPDRRCLLRRPGCRLRPGRETWLRHVRFASGMAMSRKPAA
jgi:hypothetical protein